MNLDLLVGQFHEVLIAIDMDFPINFNHDVMTQNLASCLQRSIILIIINSI